jgi:hypothetical protein
MTVAGHRGVCHGAVARSACVAGAFGVGVVALWSGCAAAAGTSPYGGTGPEGAPPGSFTVLTSQTVPKAGGTVTATHDGQKVTVTVPATAFKTKVQVTIQVPTLESIANAVSAFEVSFSMGDTAVTGTFTKAVVMTITSSAIKAGYLVEEWDNTKWVAYSHATVATGSAKITVLTDPTFAVASALTPTTTTTTTTTTPAASTTSADATPATVTGTSAETGIPVLGITLGSGGLLATGGASLLFARRRRQSASRS